MKKMKKKNRIYERYSRLLCAATFFLLLADAWKNWVVNVWFCVLERWRKDRDLFTSAAEAMGCKSLYSICKMAMSLLKFSQSKNHDFSRRRCVGYRYQKNGEVQVVNCVAEAKAEGIKVLAYWPGWSKFAWHRLIMCLLDTFEWARCKQKPYLA